MSVSRTIRVIASFVFAALSSYACDDGNDTRINPTRVDPNARFVNSAIAVRQVEVNPIVVAGGLCPLVPPLLAPFDLVVTADRTSDVSLRQVQLQFVDLFGTSGGFRSIDELELTRLFGSTLVPALGTRAFPLTLPFGCVGGQTGALNVTVTASDMFSNNRGRSMQIPVR